MEKVCAIMQPTYIPWLGYFELIYKSDTFVFYDHVQFEKQSWQQRNRILTGNGIVMLTVPVLHEKGLERSIREVRIDERTRFNQKHIQTIRQAYSKAPFFSAYFPELEKIYAKNHSFIIDLNIDIISLGMRIFGIEREILFSSELDVKGNKVEALIDVCKKLEVTTYYSPLGSKEYIDQNNLFPQHNIQLIYQAYKHPEYSQKGHSDFTSHMSFIDYLFNVGNTKPF